MVTSKYLTNPQDWEERVRVMEDNLLNCYYDYLYFGIVLNLFDAQDNADYDKEKVLLSMLSYYNRGNIGALKKKLNELKDLI